ncbi:hypothetical protein D3C72_2255740 [compost metagenome]
MNGHSELSTRVRSRPLARLRSASASSFWVSRARSRPLTLTFSLSMTMPPLLAARCMASNPNRMPIRLITSEIAPAISGAYRNPPRFSQYSRLSIHLKVLALLMGW